MLNADDCKAKRYQKLKDQIILMLFNLFYEPKGRIKPSKFLLWTHCNIDSQLLPRWQTDVILIKQARDRCWVFLLCERGMWPPCYMGLATLINICH